MRFFLCVVLLCLSTPAQTPAFEAATVKLNTDLNSGNGFFPAPGELRVTNMTLAQLIQAAYHIKTGTLFGVSAWMDSDRFDIDARTPHRSNFEEELVMLQSLLVDRFQLRFHREARPLRTQMMVLAKGGPKFHASGDQAAKERVTIRPTEISGTGIPFGHFVSILEAQLKHPLTNDTGLTGQFDLSLKYVPDDAPVAADGPSVFTALEEQLGLRIETRRGPVEVFVIDSAGKPREN